MEIFLSSASVLWLVEETTLHYLISLILLVFNECFIAVSVRIPLNMKNCERVLGDMFGSGCCFRNVGDNHGSCWFFCNDPSSVQNIQKKECEGHLNLDLSLYARSRGNLGSVWSQHPEFSHLDHESNRYNDHDRHCCWLDIIR